MPLAHQYCPQTPPEFQNHVIFVPACPDPQHPPNNSILYWFDIFHSQLTH